MTQAQSPVSYAFGTKGLGYGPATLVANGTGFANAGSSDGAGRFGDRVVRWDTTGAQSQLPGLGVPTKGSYDFEADAINAAGTVVGYADKFTADGTDLGERAVTWTPGGAISELPPLSLSNGYTETNRAIAINVSGMMAGYGQFYSLGSPVGTRAMRWSADGASGTILGTLGNRSNGVAQVTTSGINDAGTIVGTADKFDSAGQFAIGTRAVRWAPNSTVATELATLPNSIAAPMASAYAINNAGDTVGACTNGKGVCAVRWNAGGIAITQLEGLLPDKNGRADSVAQGINSAGTVIGYGLDHDASGALIGTRATRWDSSGHVTKLNLPAGAPIANPSSTVFDINDSGFCVGQVSNTISSMSGIYGTAALWTPSNEVIDLNTLLPAGSGWVYLSEANTIDNNGWVSGVGLFDSDGLGVGTPAYSRAFIMQVPEPASVVAIAASTCMVLRRRRR